jgi:hypothetical protein
MIHRARQIRLGWLLAAIVQILLPTVVSAADSQAEATSIRAASRVHVEAPGTRGCAAVHPEDCAICRVLASGARTSRPAVLQIAVVRVIAAPAVRRRLATRGAIAPGDPPQRAPPALS